jgi:hypothetical protein
MENEFNKKRQLLFVCCKRETKVANFFLFALNRKWKFVFPGQPMIKGNQRLLFQQICLSAVLYDNHPVRSTAAVTLFQALLP